MFLRMLYLWSFWQNSSQPCSGFDKFF